MKTVIFSPSQIVPDVKLNFDNPLGVRCRSDISSAKVNSSNPVNFAM